jgi:ribosomal protein S18 acetylase RimI-like enzyme
LNLRPATATDIPLIRTLAHRIWRECYPGIISGEQIEYMLGWMYSAEQLASEFTACVPWELVEENGMPIGFLSYKLESDSRVKLNKLYLLPDHQHRGHSRTLLAHVCERARALGAREVWLQVNKRNARAIAAYVKASFHIASEAVADIGHGFVMDDYFMAKAV